MPRSAGLLMYRLVTELEVLLAHPGGPFFVKRDHGAWGVPKGLLEDGESELEAARREFEEETSFPARASTFHALGEITQKGGKVVVAWAFEGDCDPAELRSNTFELEWPPKSGRVRHYPEIDRADWFTIPGARERINPAQVPLLERLQAILDGGP